MMMLSQPYFTPGGKALEYFYSLRIWLTKRRSKAAYVTDETGLRIGSEVKCKIEKSRFGTEGRECTFKILWAGDAAIQDEESWLTALKSSKTPKLKLSGAWYTLVHKDGKETKFQGKQWIAKLQDPSFKQTVIEIMDEEIVKKFESEGKNFAVSEDD